MGIGAGADFQRAHPRHQLVHQPVAGAADRDGNGDRHAALAGRAVGGAHQRIGRPNSLNCTLKFSPRRCIGVNPQVQRLCL